MSNAADLKTRSRGVSHDMSPQAIARRFDILVELDRTARALRSARPAAGSPREAPADAPPDPPPITE